MWNNRAFRRDGASDRHIPESLSAALRTSAHFPGSTPLPPPRFSGTFPPRSRERPPGSGRKSRETVPPAGPAFRLKPTRFARPSARYFQKGWPPGPDGSHCRQEVPPPAWPPRSGCSSRRERRTDPGSVLQASPPEKERRTWRWAPEYSKRRPHARDACRAAAALPFFHNKTRFLPREQETGKRAPFAKIPPGPFSWGLPAAPDISPVQAPPEIPHILRPAAASFFP